MTAPSVALVSHTDPRGAISPHVVHLVRAVGEVVDHVVVVSGSPLVPGAGDALDGLAEVVPRPQARHAVARWRHGLAVAGARVGDLDRLVLLEDSLVGPFGAFAAHFPAGHDGLRGTARSGQHLQRHLVDLGAGALRLPETEAFWHGVPDAAERTGAAPRPGTDPGPARAARLVVDLERLVQASGLPVEAVFEPTPADHLAALRYRSLRSARSAVRAGRGARGGTPAAVVAALRAGRTEAARAGDPLASWRALADGRLPLTRVDLLADHDVGGPATLSLLEQSHPGAVRGVRDLIDRSRAGRRRGTTTRRG
jgi:hypothetical protein